MTSPLFVVKDELSSPVCVSYTTGGRPVVAIRRGQVFSPEFAQTLSDALSTTTPSTPTLSTPPSSAAAASTTPTGTPTPSTPSPAARQVPPVVPRQTDKERAIESDIPARWAPVTTRAALRSTPLSR